MKQPKRYKFIEELKSKNQGKYPKILGTNILFTEDYWEQAQKRIEAYFESKKKN